MKGPKPADVPEHISEELIGELLQTVCEKCGMQYTVHTGRKKNWRQARNQFIEDHRDCTEEF
jgi:hypothetical protein